MRQRNRNLISPTSGMSLVSVLIGLGVASILVLVVGKMTQTGIKSAASVGYRHDLAALKQTVLGQLDCDQTLNVTPGTVFPMSCPSGPVTLKRRNGTPIAPNGKIGKWTINVECDGELHVGAQKQGKDPLSGKLWANLKTASDLFDGTSDFCRAHFEGQPVSDLECYDAERNANGMTSGNPSVFEEYNLNCGGTNCPRWGLRCKNNFNRTGCSFRWMGTSTGHDGTGVDLDIQYFPRGCYADNEEYEYSMNYGMWLQMTCCRLRR